MRTLQTYLLVAFFLLGLVLISGCSQTEDPTAPEKHLDAGELQKANDDVEADMLGTPFTAVLDLSDPSNPQNAQTCIEVDDMGTVHFQRCIFRGPITGDLVGNERISVIDLVVDTNGNGHARGPFIFDVCHSDLGCGTFSGWVRGPITAGMFDGKFRGSGTDGDFVGMKITGTSKSPGNGVFTLAGTILAGDVHR